MSWQLGPSTGSWIEEWMVTSSGLARVVVVAVVIRCCSVGAEWTAGFEASLDVASLVVKMRSY